MRDDRSIFQKETHNNNVLKNYKLTENKSYDIVIKHLTTYLEIPQKLFIANYTNTH